MTSRAETIEEIEKRAEAARVTMTDVCKAAGIPYTTWYRAKQNPDGLRVKKLGQIEDALKILERERAAA
jgi:precorrin-6x reductase